MKLSQLLEGVRYETALSPDTEITALTSDSRKAAEGTLFCCIRGLTRDGHDFAQTAAEAGSVVLTERDMGLSLQIKVDSTREAYAKVCENFFGNPLRRLRLIGVTGTNGKTSTTFILKHILESLGYKVGLIGTIQNMIGGEVLETHYTTPDTYELHELFAKMDSAGCELCVMEVSSHAIEQGRVAGLRFEAACFTNLSQDHLDFHGTMENYFAAKQKLFSVCGKAVVNTDDKWGERLCVPESAQKITYGLCGGSMLLAENPVYRPDGVSFRISYGGQSADVHAPTPGKFSVYNALSAIGCAIAVQDTPCLQAIAKAMSTAAGVKGRAEVYPTGRDYTVILDYAHTPDGVENILSSMREVSGGGRLVALLGCGGDRDPIKRPLMGEAAARLADFVIVTSDNPRSENPAEIIRQIMPGVLKHNTEHVVIENRREAIKYAVEHARSGDVIVLAGKGHETYQILNTGTIHFDEREVLAQVIEELESEGKI